MALGRTDFTQDETTQKAMKHLTASEQLPIFENAQAWYREDVASTRDWSYALTNLDLLEIDRALDVFKRSGKDLVNLTRADFPLPRLEAHLKMFREEVLHGRGFVLLQGLPVGDYDFQQCSTAFVGISRYIGEPVSQNGKGYIFDHVLDTGGDINQAETRAYKTASRLDFHSDYSDVVGLLCLQKAKSGGESMLASSTTLWNEMVRRRPDLAAELQKPLYITRWGNVAEGIKRYAEVPVFTAWGNRMIACLNVRATIEKAQRFPEVPRLTDKQIEALDYIYALAHDPAIHVSMDLRPGDMQFVSNASVFHSRTHYTDWDVVRRRHMLRIWLACDDGPDLPPFITNGFQGATASGRPDGIQLPGVSLKLPPEVEPV